MNFPDFGGQIVALELAYEEDVPLTVLEETHFEVQAGRVFIIGRVPYGANPDDWCAGASCAVAWDEVISYLLFESISEYQQMVGEL